MSKKSENIIEIYGEDSFRCSCCNNMYDNDQGEIYIQYCLEDDDRCQVCEDCFSKIDESNSRTIQCYRTSQENDL